MNAPVRMIPSALLVVIISGAGCGSTPEGPATAAVSGTVKFKGQPLENAQVLFIPEAPGALSASGVTDARGQYRLTTRVAGDGAIIGKHRVAITVRGPDKPLPDDELTSGLPGSNVMPGDPLIPEKYFLPDTSELTGEVQSGKNTIDFDLQE